MSAVLPSMPSTAPAKPGPALRLGHHVWHAWRSLGWGESGWFVLIGGVLGGMNLIALSDPSVGPSNGRMMFSETIGPLLCSLLLMMVWLPADRSASDSPLRVRRLATAVVLATILSALLVPWLLRLFELPSAMEIAYQSKGKAPPGWLPIFLADSLATLIPSSLAIAVLEMAGRHRRSEVAISNALDEHARLARTTLESRLAAMQARVEPRLLFDVLVDIERLYGAVPASTEPADRSAAVAQMERLITYLRVALPKLREAGSTIGAEVELLASYLDLVQGMHGGLPGFAARVPTELSGTTFHPMLLLPLVERALRNEATLPSRIEVEATLEAGRLSLVLTIAAPALCQDDDELQRLRERLQVLYAGRASLRCEDLPGPTASDAPVDRPNLDALRITRFTLELPR
ncbi:MAG: hypothetical protein ABI564_02120 [Ideonella sp.]